MLNFNTNKGITPILLPIIAIIVVIFCIGGVLFYYGWWPELKLEWWPELKPECTKNEDCGIDTCQQRGDRCIEIKSICEKGRCVFPARTEFPQPFMCWKSQCINPIILEENTSNWIEYLNQKWKYIVKYSPDIPALFPPKELEDQSKVGFAVGTLGAWIEAYPNEEGIENLEELVEKMNYLHPDAEIPYKDIRKYVEEHLEIIQEKTQLDLIPALRLILKTKPPYGEKKIGEIILFFGKDKKSYYFIKSALNPYPFSPRMLWEFKADMKKRFDYFISTFKFIDVNEDITAQFNIAKWVYNSSQLQVFGKTVSEGEVVFANLDGNSDDTYTTSNRYCLYDGKHHDYSDAWDIERKYINENKYQILVKGSSDEDCDRGQPQNRGWIQLNLNSDWEISRVNKCSISPDNDSNGVIIETYCRVDEKRKKIEWQSGSMCGGCCLCPDGAGVDIIFIVEKE